MNTLQRYSHARRAEAPERGNNDRKTGKRVQTNAGGAEAVFWGELELAGEAVKIASEAVNDGNHQNNYMWP